MSRSTSLEATVARYKCNTSETAALQEDLNALSDWANLNELEFQPRKCENHNVDLKRVDSQKDLGVIVTGNLLWNSHVESITAKANRMLGFVKHNCFKEITSNALKVLYLALVRSHLGYCSRIWAPRSVIRNILLVESVQRRATKFICKLPKRVTIVIGTVLSNLIYYVSVIG